MDKSITAQNNEIYELNYLLKIKEYLNDQFLKSIWKLLNFAGNSSEKGDRKTKSFQVDMTGGFSPMVIDDESTCCVTKAAVQDPTVSTTSIYTSILSVDDGKP